MGGYSMSPFRGPAILRVAAMAGMGLTAIPASNFAGHEVVAPRLPKKQQKAIKRQKHAAPKGAWPRSKNAPTKRKLKRNLVTHGRRVRRKHRRAGK